MLAITIKNHHPEPDAHLRLAFAELEVTDALNGVQYACTLVATRRGLSFKVMSKKALHETETQPARRANK